MLSYMSEQDVLNNTLFDTVQTSKMFVARYGRPLLVAKVQTMARNFDLNAIGTVYLSMRSNDSYAILDGQHRVAAANLKGIHELPSRVFIDLSYEEEAALYVKFATVNKQTSLDRFKARVEAKELLALDIVDLLSSLNLQIAYSGPAGGGIQAVTAVEGIYKKGGRKHLRDVLSTIYRTWQTHPRAYVQPILLGISMFIQRYDKLTVENDGVKLDWGRLIDKLACLTPESLIAKASQLRGVISQVESNGAIGMVILYEYNKGLKTNKLPEWVRNA